MGITGQIMALFIAVSVTMAGLLFAGITYSHNMQEKQLSQALAMVQAENQSDADRLTANRDNKVEMILTIMSMITPDFVLSQDLTALELHAGTFVEDPDIRSVTFLDKDGTFLAGDRNIPDGGTLSRDMEMEGEKLGRIVIGINQDILDQNLIEVNRRIVDFEGSANEDRRQTRKRLMQLIAITIGLLLSILLAMGVLLKRIIGPVRRLTDWTKQVAAGHLEYHEIKAPVNEIGKLNANFGRMVDRLRTTAGENELNNWLKTGQSGLAEELWGELTVEQLAGKALGFVANYLEVPVGALYVDLGDGRFSFTAGHAFLPPDTARAGFVIGEGFIGRTARDAELRMVADVPADYLPISSGLGSRDPATLLLLPLVSGGTAVGVLELGSFTAFSAHQIDFLKTAATPIAVAINSAISRVGLKYSRDNAQQLAEQLQVQQEELRVSNEELEAQAKELQASEEALKAQQEELQAMNEEMVEKTRMLEAQMKQTKDEQGGSHEHVL
ncbi:MAG: GAF domain-containing protein [Desulfobacterales bacterium]